MSFMIDKIEVHHDPARPVEEQVDAYAASVEKYEGGFRTVVTPAWTPGRDEQSKDRAHRWTDCPTDRVLTDDKLDERRADYYRRKFEFTRQQQRQS